MKLKLKKKKLAVLTRVFARNVLPFHQAVKKSGRNNNDRITKVVLLPRGFTVYKDGYFVSCEIPIPKGHIMSVL